MKKTSNIQKIQTYIIKMMSYVSRVYVTVFLFLCIQTSQTSTHFVTYPSFSEDYISFERDC